jgi:hypothetical protein
LLLKITITSKYCQNKAFTQLQFDISLLIQGAIGVEIQHFIPLVHIQEMQLTVILKSTVKHLKRKNLHLHFMFLNVTKIYIVDSLIPETLKMFLALEYLFCSLIFVAVMINVLMKKRPKKDLKTKSMIRYVIQCSFLIKVNFLSMQLFIDLQLFNVGCRNFELYFKFTKYSKTICNPATARRSIFQQSIW